MIHIPSPFSPRLLPLGYLVYKSGFLPRALGVALMVGAFSYLTELLVGFLFPDLGEGLLHAIAMPAALAEVSLITWLLAKGIKTRPHLRRRILLDLTHPTSVTITTPSRQDRLGSSADMGGCRVRAG